jgi:hypothetical protein
MRQVLIGTLALLIAPAAWAELSPEQVAKVRHEQKKAESEIEKKHGNKKPQDMSRSEFQAMQSEKLAAREKVLEKEGVDAKEFDRSAMKQNRADRATTEAKIKDLEKKDADAAAAKAKADAEKAKEPAEIPIQRGFNENHPVELENKGPAGGEPQVEKGIPEDVQRDIDEARLQGNETGNPSGYGPPPGREGAPPPGGDSKKKKSK